MTIPRGRSHLRRGIAVHEARSLDPPESTSRRRIPCTSVARTLLDLAGTVPRRTLDRALEQAQIVRLFDLAAVKAVLANARGRPGAAALRAALASLPDEPVLLRSELERRFLELARRAGLRPPVVNGMVEGYEVDFHWPAERLIVEVDGYATHGTRAGFERDRQRDLDLALAGRQVIRLSWRQITESPERVAAVLRERNRAAAAQRP